MASKQSSIIALYGVLFTPATIRKVTRLINYTSESSQRYERGLKPTQLHQAINRARYLIMSIHNVHHIALNYLVYSTYTPLDINVKISNLVKVLGPSAQQIKIPSILDILQRLGFNTHLDNVSEAIKVTVPDFRSFDITREIDIIEEIARVYGFDNFADTLPNLNNYGSLTPREVLIRKLRNKLTGIGLSELVNYSLYSSRLNSNNDVVSIKNPLTAEYVLLRQTLLYNILSTISYNVKNNNGYRSVYEVGRTFSQAPSFNETYAVSGVIVNEEKSTDNFDIFASWLNAKGMLDEVLNTVVTEISWKRASHLDHDLYADLFHPYHTCQIYSCSSFIGYFGQLNPRILKKFNIDSIMYGFELNAEILLRLHSTTIYKKDTFKPYSLYPSILRDISITVPKHITSDNVKEKIIALGSPLLNKCKFVSFYEGKPVRSDARSLSFRLYYRVNDRTLTIKEVDKLHQNLYQALKDISFH